MKRIYFVVSFSLLAASMMLSQVKLGGQISAYGVKSDRSQNPRVINKGVPTIGWRLDFFLDALVTENVVGLVNVRILEDENPWFDYVAVRVTDIANLGINFQVGKFDMPFGNLAERRFPEKNFLFGLPLIHEYRTALPNQIITKTDLFNNRGKGAGMRLVDLGIYDVGAMVFGDIGRLHYAIAVSNGTISSPYGNPLNLNNDFGKIVRLTYTPMMGLTFGGSATMGAYLPDYGKPLATNKSVDDYTQKAAEFDIDFTLGHFLFYGEAVYSEWQVPLGNEDAKLSVIGYYAESKYTLIPRLYIAGRVGGLMFSQLDFDGVKRRWDYDMFEAEAGFGYFIDRNAVVKIVRRETRTLGITDPQDNLTALQIAIAF